MMSLRSRAPPFSLPVISTRSERRLISFLGSYVLDFPFVCSVPGGVFFFFSVELDPEGRWSTIGFFSFFSPFPSEVLEHLPHIRRDTPSLFLFLSLVYHGTFTLSRERGRVVSLVFFSSLPSFYYDPPSGKLRTISFRNFFKRG